MCTWRANEFDSTAISVKQQVAYFVFEAEQLTVITLFAYSSVMNDAVAVPDT